MLDKTDLQPPYEHAGDDYLKDYIAEIKQPKQPQAPLELPADSEVEPKQELNSDQPQEPSQYQQKRGRSTAEFTVITLDKVLSNMVAVYAHSESIDEFRADKEDISDLTDQLSVYFTESNLDLPPWVFALVTTGYILMKKFKAAGAVRKINLELKKYRDENTSLKNELDLLTTKNKVLELKKQVEKLETKTD